MRLVTIIRSPHTSISPLRAPSKIEMRERALNVGSTFPSATLRAQRQRELNPEERRSFYESWTERGSDRELSRDIARYDESILASTHCSNASNDIRWHFFPDFFIWLLWVNILYILYIYFAWYVINSIVHFSTFLPTWFLYFYGTYEFGEKKII